MRIHGQKQSQPEQGAALYPSRLTKHSIASQAEQALPHVNAKGQKTETGKTPPTAFAHDFSRIPLHSKDPVSHEANLTVSTPGDSSEQEADRIADQVMTSSSHIVISERFSGQSQGEIAAAPATMDHVLASPGKPLEAGLRQNMEHRFGHDFSRVRVHSGAVAEQSAWDVNANAYTVGHDIVFGAGRYKPSTPEGQRLLAHELVHVIQQEASGNDAGYRLSRQKDEGKPQPPPKKEEPPKTKEPPPKTKEPPPATATPPCVPKFISLKAEITGTVGVREVNGRCQLVLGEQGKTNGATFTSKVDVPPGCTGTLQYVQLVNMCRSLTQGIDLRRSTGGADWIDLQDPIDEQKVSKAGSVEFSSNDSPGQPVTSKAERVQAKDSFKTWLMWKPDQPADAHRVPLAVTTWSWSAIAEAKKPDETDCTKRWTVTQQKTAGGSGKATKDSPTATKTVTGSDPPIEDGKDKKC